MSENPHPRPPAGRVYDAALHLLDRQVIDSDGKLVCKVDDLELELDETGRAYVAAILAGPGALGVRIGDHIGQWMVRGGQLLSPRDEADYPPRIDADLITDIGSAVTVAVPRDVLRVAGLEDWIREYLIERLPGASDAGG
jgi:sporulation protein YlmC with PRC-barrel domain